jgi:ribosome maturation factor RimP
MTDNVVEKITSIAERVARPEGIEVVDVTLAGRGASRLLRITIDKPEGVSHADCELVSQQVGAILDVEDVVPGAGYRLEVTSPGVERSLRGLRDFERFQGKKARVVLRELAEGRKDWEGTLAGVAGDTITLEADGRPVRFSIDQVARANLKLDW